MSFGVIIAAGLGAYAISRMSKGTDDVDEVDVDVTKLDDGSFDKLIDELTRGNEEAKAFYGPMLVTVKLKVSGLEKFLSSESTLKREAKKFALDVQRRLPSRCPGAPKIVGDPKLKFKDVDGGYKVLVTWPAQWSHTRVGALKPAVVECMKKLVRENKAIGGRVQSLTAVRLS